MWLQQVCGGCRCVAVGYAFPFLAFVVQKNVGTGGDVTDDVTIGIKVAYFED